MTNRLFNRLRHSIGLALCVTFCCAAAAEADTPFYEEEREPRRFRLFGPAMHEPADQIAFADELHEEGRLRKAQRQYRALVRYWPNAPEAAAAQWAYARVLAERGKWSRATDAYESLMQTYTGLVPHDEVLAEVFEIGLTLKNRRRGDFLFLPGFTSPEKALPVFELILTYGPQWERAPEALMHIARIQEAIDRPEEALVSFERLEFRYPRHPLAEEAAFGRAHALYVLALDYPNHVDGIELAMHALGGFIQRYPESTHGEAATAYLRELHQRAARIHYEQARFYDRIARQPKAAIIMYERFLEQFPHSEHSDRARERLEALRDQHGEPNEE